MIEVGESGRRGARPHCAARARKERSTIAAVAGTRAKERA